MAPSAWWICLLAQLLPAATYPDDLSAAAGWLAAYPNDVAGIDAQNWDLSVKAIAHYPTVVQMMAGDMDWTLALGQAYAVQEPDVLAAVQRLRLRAWNAGTLRSSPEQRVALLPGGAVSIVPAQPAMIFVPRYDPEVVFMRPVRPLPGGYLVFARPDPIGAWLNTDCNWQTRRVYYHGWAGTGWIAASRPHIHVNTIYVNEIHRRRVWVNPHYRSVPVVVNRGYIDRHIDRYEFTRGRYTRDPRVSHGPGVRVDPARRTSPRPQVRVDPARRTSPGPGARVDPARRTSPGPGARVDPARRTSPTPAARRAEPAARSQTQRSGGGGRAGTSGRGSGQKGDQGKGAGREGGRSIPR